LRVRRGGFFLSQRRKDAKKSNRSLPLACLPQVGFSLLATCLSAGGLCVSASLRAIHFFFIIQAKPAYRQAGHRDLPAKVGAKKY
jgi:hypothetical protein